MKQKKFDPFLHDYNLAITHAEKGLRVDRHGDKVFAYSPGSTVAMVLSIAEANQMARRLRMTANTLFTVAERLLSASTKAKLIPLKSLVKRARRTR